MSAKYLRAISDKAERKTTEIMMKVKTAFGVACILAVVASVAGVILSEAIGEKGGAVPDTVLYVTLAAAILCAVAYFVLRSKVNTKLKDALTRPARDGECGELSVYRAKLYKEFVADGAAFRKNAKIVAVGIVLMFFFMFVDSLVNPESDGPGTVSLVGCCIFAASCAVAGVMGLRYRFLKNAHADPETAKLAQKIDETIGIPCAYSRQEDTGANDLSYLFPDPEIRERAEKAKKDFGLAMTINGVVASAMSLCIVIVFCSGKVFEQNLYGYAFPMFLSIALALLTLSLIQPSVKVGKIEKEQLASLEKTPEYSDNLELYRKYEEYSEHKGRTMIYATIASIVVGFALAIPFPHAAWSVFSALILVAGAFLNNKFYVAFRRSVIPLEKKIDIGNAERKNRSEESVDGFDGNFPPSGSGKERPTSECTADGERSGCVVPAKRLGDMTLGELWELFPITLVDPKPEKWRADFESERDILRRILGTDATAISHVGSTAVGTIKSKPIVDIVVETDDVGRCARRLADAGYILMREDGKSASFNKGYTPLGYADKVYHIHVRNTGDADEKYFCAYLKAHPDAAREYEALKTRLLAEYGKDRDGYTAAKSEFVKKITELAEKEDIG